MITLCIFVMITFEANAQTKNVVKKTVPSTLAVPTAKISQEAAKIPSGPTKEQTVAFIKDYFKNSNISTGIVFIGKSEWEANSVSDYLINFDEGKSIITAKYCLNYRYRDAKENLSDDTKTPISNSIDVSKVIGVSIERNQTRVSLRFDFVDNSYESIPLDYSCGKDCDPYIADKKIIQAFRHLRKLCGAPEPISFDN